jgi:hypothetical protein
MQDVCHSSPAKTVFNPDQLGAIPECRSVLRTRSPLVAIVFLKYKPVLSQLYVCPSYDGRWGIVHAMNPYPYVLKLFLGQSYPAFHRHITSLPELQGLIYLNFFFAVFPSFFLAYTAKNSCSHKAIEVPFDGILTATCIRLLRSYEEFDTTHYTLDTLQLPNSLLSRL